MDLNVSRERYAAATTTAAKPPEAEEDAEVTSRDATAEQGAAQTQTGATSTQQWAASQGIERSAKLTTTAATGSNDIVDDILKLSNPATALLQFIQQHSENDGADLVARVLAKAPDPAKLIAELSAGGGPFPPPSKSFMLTLFNTALGSTELLKGPAITTSWSKSAGLEKDSTASNRTEVCLKSIFEQLADKLDGNEVLDLAMKVNTSSLTGANNTHYHYLYHNNKSDSTTVTNAAADLLGYILDKGGAKLDRTSLSDLENAVTRGPLKEKSNTESGHVVQEHKKWISNHHGGGHAEPYFTSDAYTKGPTPCTSAILDKISKLSKRL